MSSWLVDDYGFQRCLSEPSIFVKKEGEHELVLINAVDNQLYYSTCDDMRKKFEKDVCEKYDVDMMGQAHWYLQSRITQHTNYDVTIDQSRYIALMCNRFMPNIGIENITERELLKYAAPLPTEFIASKEDASENYMQVKELEEEFGFEYASLIGMLIYLMNTAFILHFPITKLARFMALPGKTHSKAATHLLKFFRCHHRKYGLT